MGQTVGPMDGGLLPPVGFWMLAEDKRDGLIPPASGSVLRVASLVVK